MMNEKFVIVFDHFDFVYNIV